MSLARRTRHRLLGLILFVGVVGWVWASVPNPRMGKWWDEKYSMVNVEHILSTGGWAPVMAWYPALSHLPLAAVLESTVAMRSVLGLESLGIVRADGTMGPWAFWIGRWMSALFAAVSVGWVYRFGARTISPSGGLLAAALLVLSPSFHFYASVFKPDMLALMLTLMAFSAARRAFDRYEISDYLVAGALVGLAASAKQTGALAAIPLIVVTALRPKAWRRWFALGVAGLLSMLVFFALNPDPELIFRYLLAEQRFETWAIHQEPSSVPTIFYLPVLAMDSSWHGPIVGAAAWLGIVGMLIALGRSRLAAPADGNKALTVAFVILYPVGCALGSNHPKANLLLPTIVFTTVAAAWLLAALWERIKARADGKNSRWLLAPCLMLLTLATAVPFADYFYARVVYRTTTDEVVAAVKSRLGSVAHRAIVYERELGELNVTSVTNRGGPTFAFVRPVDRLVDLPPAELDVADYEIFAPHRLESSDAAHYRARLARFEPESLWIHEPSVFSRRGPSIAVLEHPWEIKSRRTLVWKESGGRGRRPTARLPRRVERGSVVSFDVAWSRDSAAQCTLLLEDKPLDLFYYYRDAGEPRFMSNRMVLKDRARKLRVECDKKSRARSEPSVTLVVWRPGASVRGAPAGGEQKRDGARDVASGGR